MTLDSVVITVKHMGVGNAKSWRALEVSFLLDGPHLAKAAEELAQKGNIDFTVQGVSWFAKICNVAEELNGRTCISADVSRDRNLSAWSFTPHLGEAEEVLTELYEVICREIAPRGKQLACLEADVRYLKERE